jgi:hypothetical protein
MSTLCAQEHAKLPNTLSITQRIGASPIMQPSTTGSAK